MQVTFFSRLKMFRGSGIDSPLRFFAAFWLPTELKKRKNMHIFEVWNNMEWKTNAECMFTHPRHVISNRLTFRRQALVTTCLGSTTSTRGSLMATLRMQLMSNPYTFSHPAHTHNMKIWRAAPLLIHVHHSMCLIDLHFLNFYALSRLCSLCFCQVVKKKRQ